MKKLYLLTLLLGYCYAAYAQFPSIKPTNKLSYKITNDLKTMGLNAHIPESLEMIDVAGAFGASEFYSNKFKEHEKEVENLLKANDELAKKSDTASLKKIFDNNKKLVDIRKQIEEYKELSGYYAAINRINGIPKATNYFLPVKNRYQASFFFNSVEGDKPNTFSNVVLQGNQDRATIFTDLVSGTFAIGRISFSSVFYSGDNLDSLELATKILNGGGLTNLRFEIPLFFMNTTNVALYVSAKPGAIADIPIFGSEIPKSSFVGYLEFPIEGYLELKTNEGNFSLFGNFKASNIRGTSAFYQGLKSPVDNPLNQSFWISQVYLGINITDKYRISANIPFATTRSIVLPDAVQIGIQINQIGKK
ncbi:hypothetical protein MM213_01225 [Belliella sp. R4-6]|uniref:Uncharacterized protein n=1 Tax=Belliella alkalica TaxID=1730871 RepID=A0ABS9V809_9BACT|nr:hypothetical protein [Belliella alkalica]MCH7412088.1 hypothetical protein [Belliella alkalica]